MQISKILLTSFIFSSTVLANDKLVLHDELKELFSLNIEELTMVSVASKREEKVTDAPGIITVVTADEIKRYGARNLRDVLDRQTHIQIVGSNLFPHNRTSMRGVTFTHVETDVLLLLNGRPIRDPGDTSANHDIYNSFPIESIKQIEIIRGPGSVLYGTNAFAGVIDIITKDAPSSHEGNLSLSYGSFENKKTTLTGGGNLGEFKYFASLNAIDNQGDDFNNINGEGGSSGTYKTGASGLNLLLNAKYKGFTLNALATDMKTDHAKSVFTLPSSGHELERQYADIGYKHSFNQNWEASLNYAYHHYREKFDLGTSSLFQIGDGQDHLVEISSNVKLTDKLNLLAGGVYNIIKYKVALGTQGVTNQNISSYLQTDYQLFDWLKLIGGFQFNKPDDVHGEFSPRFSALIKINKQWGLKLLYGEAFRQATPVERYISTAAVVGDAKLKPETIKTFDAQIYFNGRDGSIALTYFHSEQNDLITRTGSSPQQIINSGSMEYDGFELEGKYDFRNGLNFIGNLSYQTNEHSDGHDDETYSPDWMIKTGMSYDSTKGYQLSLFNSYFAKSTLQNHQLTSVTATNPDADGYNLLTANLRINLGKVLNSNSLSSTTLSLYGDNLLDESIFFPSINRTSVNSLPHHMGRGIYATISIDF